MVSVLSFFFCCVALQIIICPPPFTQGSRGLRVTFLLVVMQESRKYQTAAVYIEEPGPRGKVNFNFDIRESGRKSLLHNERNHFENEPLITENPILNCLKQSEKSLLTLSKKAPLGTAVVKKLSYNFNVEAFAAFDCACGNFRCGNRH